MGKPARIIYKDTIKDRDGDKIDRLVMDVNGKTVQVNRYGGDNNNVLVKIGGLLKKMALKDVEKFVDDRTD